MASSASTATGIEHPEEPSRRDFLYIATGTVAAVGAAAVLVPLIAQMNPDASTLAAGGPVDLDISKIEPGQQVVVRWRERPIFVFHRTPETVEDAAGPQIDRRNCPTRIPSRSSRRPTRPTGTARSKPEFGVLVGICTHLGCIPMFYPQPSALDAGLQLAGRLFLSLPRLQI